MGAKAVSNNSKNDEKERQKRRPRCAKKRPHVANFFFVWVFPIFRRKTEKRAAKDAIALAPKILESSSVLLPRTYLASILRKSQILEKTEKVAVMTTVEDERNMKIQPHSQQSRGTSFPN